jgi:hypothetical protein
MPTGVGCTVYADGVRVADGSPTDNPLDPTALSGLSLTWGRESTVDQPQASTCAFDVIDTAGGEGFSSRFFLGSTIQVTAGGSLYPAPTVPAFTNPSFEAPFHEFVKTTKADISQPTTNPHTGTKSLAVQPTLASTSWTIAMAPAPLSADPTAWDTIPVSDPGQVWTYGAWVFVPNGITVTVQPVLFSAPHFNAWSIPAGVQTSVSGLGTWVLAQGTFTANAAHQWVGLQVSASSAGGQTWNTTTGTWNGATLTWNGVRTVYIDDVTILGPLGGTTSTVLVFEGRIVSLASQWHEGAGRPMLKISCADFISDIDNRNVGDEPWPMEYLLDRANRILTLGGGGIDLDIDPSIAIKNVSWRDVDRQPVGGLLRGLAASVDGIMWSAAHITTGAYILMEDPNTRPSGTVLGKVGGIVVIVPRTMDLMELSACEIDREPITWTTSVEDVTTRVEVTWLEQVTGPPASTLEHTYTVIDAAAEAQRGVRSFALASQLTTEADASTVASAIKARTRGGDWVAGAISIDDDDIAGSNTTIQRLLNLLDGTVRNGLAIAVTELPAWAPPTPTGEFPVYLEGGTYQFTDGRWVLDLTVSNATSVGQSVTWNDLTTPAYKWNEFDPGIAWDELRGVGPT